MQCVIHYEDGGITHSTLTNGSYCMVNNHSSFYGALSDNYDTCHGYYARGNYITIFEKVNGIIGPFIVK